MMSWNRAVVDPVRIEALHHLAVLVAEHLVGDRRDVEHHAPVHGFAETDLVEDGARGHVARRRFLPDRVVGFHEALAGRVVELRPGDERGRLHRHPARAERPDAPPRVELDELHVAEGCAGLEGERVAAAGHVHRVAGDAEEPAGAAGGEDRRPGLDHHQLGAVPPDPQRPDDPAVVDEQLDHQHVLDHVDAGGQDGGAERQREVGPPDVLGDEDARMAVIPARREIVVAVPLLEPGAHLDQLRSRAGASSARARAQGALVHESAADDRVRVVLARVVGGIERGRGRGEAARRVRGRAALAELALDHDEDARARLAGAPRRAEGGQPAADDQDVGGERRRCGRADGHPGRTSCRSISRPPRGGAADDS